MGKVYVGENAQARAVQEALHKVATAQADARDACEEFARVATGWKAGDRVNAGLYNRRRRHDVIVEVVNFSGTHPTTWRTEPLVLCLIVKRDGTTGTQPARLPIDLNGNWRKRYTLEPTQ